MTNIDSKIIERVDNSFDCGLNEVVDHTTGDYPDYEFEYLFADGSDFFCDPFEEDYAILQHGAPDPVRVDCNITTPFASYRLIVDIADEDWRTWNQFMYAIVGHIRTMYIDGADCLFDEVEFRNYVITTFWKVFHKFQEVLPIEVYVH